MIQLFHFLFIGLVSEFPGIEGKYLKVFTVGNMIYE